MMSPYTPLPLIEELKNYRRMHHLTQEQLAERIGCCKEAVQKWEQGRARPGRLARQAIMRALQIPLPLGEGE